MSLSGFLLPILSICTSILNFSKSFFKSSKILWEILKKKKNNNCWKMSFDLSNLMGCTLKREYKFISAIAVTMNALINCYSHFIKRFISIILTILTVIYSWRFFSNKMILWTPSFTSNTVLSLFLFILYIYHCANPSIAEMPNSGYQQPSPQPPIPKKQKSTQFPKLKHGNDKIIFTVSDEIHAKMLQKLHYESKDFSKNGKFPN